MRSVFAEWTQITSQKPKEELFQTRLEIYTKNYQFWRQQNNWHDSISTLFHNLLVLLLITFTLLLLLTFLSAPAVSCYFTVLRFHLLPPFPAAQQKHNWIAPHRPPDKSISYSQFCLVKFCIFMLCPVSRSLIIKITARPTPFWCSCFSATQFNSGTTGWWSVS